MTRRIILVAIGICGAVTAGLGQENRKPAINWPQFRGPNGAGVAPDGMKLPVQFGPAKNVLWKTPLPPGHSSPCIWEDRIFLTSFDKAGSKLETICLDRVTGKIVWRRAAPAEKFESVHKVNTLASPTPAADGQRVYAYFGSFGLLCYDFQGELKWKRPLPDPNLPTGPLRHGSGASPIVAGDLVLLHAKLDGRHVLLAVNGRTGDTVWQKPCPPFYVVWSTPVIHRDGGEDEIIVLGGGQVAGYALRDGADRWRAAGLPQQSCSTPVVGDGLVFMTLSNPYGAEENVVALPPFEEFAKQYDKNGDGKIGLEEIPADFALITRGRADKIGDWYFLREALPGFDRNKDKALDREEWAKVIAGQTRTAQFALQQNAVAAVRLGGRGDVTQTHVAWRETKGVPEVPSPLYYQGRLYLVKERGIVSCCDAKTGKLHYRERLGAVGQCYASPIAGDGKVYAASDGGVLVVLKAGDRFEVLAKNDLQEPIMATPAIADGKLYVRTAGHLYAFGE